MESILSVRGVTKDYVMGEVTVNALRGVSCELYRGEFVAILGASGSGKSTLLNILGGIDRPTSGEVLFGGRNIGGMTEKELTMYRRLAVGFVFQFYNLIPNLTTAENILLASDLSKNALPAAELLEMIGMSDRARHFPSQLSGGQQQRVAIARALAKNPSMLLCDEPTGALDFATSLQVLKILREFNKKYNKTVAIITHNAGIGGMADRVFHIRDGLLDGVTVNESPLEPEEVGW